SDVCSSDLLTGLAAHYGFDIDTPFDELPQRVREIVLYGSGSERIRFNYLGERGNRYQREHVFEGIVPNLERRYRETDSALVREELAKYLATQVCPECQGTRLRTEARHVFVAGHAIYQISALTLRQVAQFIESLRLAGKRQAIADKIVREILNRLRFLNDVGLDYLSLDRSADSLS